MAGPSARQLLDELTLRDTKSAELDFVLAAEADLDTAPYIIGWERARHERAIVAADEAHLLIVDGAVPVGFALLAGLASETRSIELRRIVVAPKGQGIGRRALELILEHAFSTLGASRVWLDVMVHNVRAQRAYAAVGFAPESNEGSAHWTPDGRPLAIMSVLRARWSAGA